MSRLFLICSWLVDSEHQYVDADHTVLGQCDRYSGRLIYADHIRPPLF